MYLFYIDESGEIGYNSGTKYFVYNAFGIHEQNWKNINNQVNDLKTKIFKSDKAPILEIKSNNVSSFFEVFAIGRVPAF